MLTLVATGIEFNFIGTASARFPRPPLPLRQAYPQVCMSGTPLEGAILKQVLKS